MQITIEIPDELERTLTEQATKLNMSLETLILDSLAQWMERSDPDDTANHVVLEQLNDSLADVKAGRVYPIAELWDGIDA